MKRPEEVLHRSLAAYLAACLPRPWLFWHTPNGGGRSKAEAGILKALGTRAGMPDLFVLGPNSRLIALEVKAPPRRLRDGTKSRTAPAVSDAQRDVIAALGEIGVPTIIVRDLDEAIAALLRMGVPLTGRTR